MAGPEYTDWNLDSIVERDIRITDEILDILTQWDREYQDALTP